MRDKKTTPKDSDLAESGPVSSIGIIKPKRSLAGISRRKKIIILLLLVLLLGAGILTAILISKPSKDKALKPTQEQIVNGSYDQINNQDFGAVEEDLTSEINTGIKDDERRYQAYANLGLSYIAQGKLDEALEALLEAENIKQEETAGDALAMIARIYASKGETETAINYFKKAIARLKATPENADDGFIPNLEAEITNLGGTP